MISSTVIGIVAQRLVRKICRHCKKERFLTEEEVSYLQIQNRQYRVWYGEGCVECRTGIFEVMDFTDNMRAMLSDTVELNALYEVAKRDGLINLRQVAIRKMLEGITTYEEVVAVT